MFGKFETNQFVNVVTDKIKINWLIITIFILIGITFKFIGFDVDKESYLTLFSTISTIMVALIGFIGIFFVYLLQNIRDKIFYYINDIDRLKIRLKIYSVLIKEYQPQKINVQLDEIKRQIKQIDFKIDHNTDRPEDINERQVLTEIEYSLNLILKYMKLEPILTPYKDAFLFTIFNIFLLAVSIAFNHINLSNEDYAIILNYGKFLKMPFIGFIFGLYFIILRDITNILEKFFISMEIVRE